MWWNIWGNQILSWSRDRNIGYLSIYCYCWSTLNSILRTPLYIRYLVLKYQYHSQNAIKYFTIPGQYNKDNAYWADLFTRIKSCNNKIGMDMIYLPIFKFWDYIYIFKVQIVYYYLVLSISNWWNIKHYSSKSLSWYIHAHPVSCKT